jgi:outer membrane protein assembly factor BamA
MTAALAQQDSAAIVVKSSQISSQFFVLPLVVRSVETDWTFGIASAYTFRTNKGDSLLRASNEELAFLYSINKQLILIQSGRIFFPEENYILEHQLSYSDFPDKFWGLGTNAKEANLENYTFKQMYLQARVLKKITKHIYVGLQYELQKVFRVDYKAGGLFEQENVLGRQSYLTSGAGLSLVWDNRNHAFVPSSGLFAEIYLSRFDKSLQSDFNYTNLRMNVKKFFPLFNQRNVLALEALAQLNYGDVPLRSLASIGGSNNMRGYYNGRFRDENSLALQAEYRFPVWRRFSGVAFCATGNVANLPSKFQLNQFKFAYGAGLRFAINRKEKLNIRADYGFTADGNSGFYLQLSEAF